MSENTQINVSTTTEIVNVDVTETLQPVSLECFFANGSAQDTVVNVSETVQNIELNVTESQAQNVEIDFYYPAGPQGPPGPGTAGSSLWGTISGTLSAQTDLWRYLSAVGTSNFDIVTLNNYLSTTPVLLSSLNVNGQILSAGVSLFDIFLTTEFAANSGKYESVYSNVVSNSANWNTAYNIATSYSSASSSFAPYSYVDNNFLALSGGIVSGPVRINNDLTVFGNLTASGTTTFANTVFSVTSALSVVHVGSGPAVWIGNNGDGDIASFYDIDEGIEILHVGGNNGTFPNVGVKTSTPNKDFTVNGEISASNTIYDNVGNSQQWNQAYNTATVYQTNSATYAPKAVLRSHSIYSSGDYAVQQGRNVELSFASFSSFSNVTITLPRQDTNDNAQTGDELLIRLGAVPSNGSVTIRQYTYIGSLPYLGTFTNIVTFPGSTPNQTIRLRLGGSGTLGFIWTLLPTPNLFSPTQIGLITPNTGTFTTLSATGVVYASTLSGVNSLTVFGNISGSNTNVSFNQGQATGFRSFATNTGQATGSNSFAEGNNTKAYGSGSHAEGINTTASGLGSHAEGNANIASGVYAHVQGSNNEASGLISHAMGSRTRALGEYSFAGGRRAVAKDNYSYVWATETGTSEISSTRVAQYLISAAGGVFIPGNVGIGTDNDSNALTVSGLISTANHGTSEQWNSAYTTVQSSSAGWGAGGGTDLSTVINYLSTSNVTLSTVTLNPVAVLSGTNFITSRILQDKLGEIISVKDFGARGNGTTNDWLPIQRALSAAAGIARVYIPQGLYFISQELRIPSNSYIYGAGIGTTIIKLSSTANATQCVMTNSQNTRSVLTNQGNENITIKDLELDGNVSRFPGSYSPVGDTSGTGLCLSNVRNALIERVSVHDTCRHCIDICAPETSITFNPLDYVPNPSFNVHLKDIIAYGAGDDNITTHFSHSITIENAYVPYTGGTEVATNSNGIEIDDGSYDITIIGGYIKNCRRGLEVKGHSWAPAAKRIKVYGLTVENCVRNFGIRHLGFDFTDSKTAYDVSLYNCTSIAPVSSIFTTDTPRSLQISNYDGVFVKDFKVVGDHNASRAVTIQERARNVKIDGMTFTQISGAITGITDALLYVDSTTQRNVSLQNLIFRDCVGLPIYITGNIPGIVIDGVDAFTTVTPGASSVVDFTWAPTTVPYTVRNVSVSGYNYVHTLGGSHNFDYTLPSNVGLIENIVPSSPASANTQYTVARLGWREGTGQALNAGIGVRMDFTSNIFSGVSAGLDVPVAYIGTRKVNGTDSDVTSNLIFGTLSANNASMADRMLITPTGNVGINTAAPNERLTVRGSISATDTIHANSYLSGGVNLLDIFALSGTGGGGGGPIDRLINGSYQAILSSNGDLTLPGAIVTASNSKLDLVGFGPNTAYLTTTPDDSTALFMGADVAELRANTYASIATNTGGTTHLWEFGADGNLKFPDNTTQTTAFTGNPNPQTLSYTASSAELSISNGNNVSLSSLQSKYIYTAISQNVLSNRKYAFDTSNSSLTATLPASPQIGDEIEFFDVTGYWFINNLVIANNGNYIEQKLETLECDVKFGSIQLIYVGPIDNIGWRIIPKPRHSVPSIISPIVSISSDIDIGYDPILINFVGINNLDSSFAPVNNWYWNLTGGNTPDYFTQNVSYNYSIPGVYTVNLTASNAVGIGTASKTITALPLLVPVPTISSNLITLSGFVPLTASFIGFNTLPVSSSPVTSWYWNLTGGNTIDYTTQAVTYTYTTSGTYTVNLTASNASGNGTTSVTVTAVPIPPPSIPTSGLVAWFKADTGVTESGGAVTAWADQSGLGNNATAFNGPVLISNQLNGRPAIDFDGTNDYMTFTLTPSLTSGSGRTYIQIYKYDVLVGQSGTFDGENTEAFIFQNGSSLYYNDGSQIGPVAGTFTTNYFIETIVVDGSNGSTTLRINGVDKVTGTMGRPALTNFIIGARDAGSPNQYANFKLVETIVYNRTLSLAEIQQIETYANVP